MATDPFEVFNSVQDHVLLAAQAHVERRILEAFAEAVDAVTTSRARGLLSEVCDLHVLARSSGSEAGSSSTAGSRRPAARR